MLWRCTFTLQNYPSSLITPVPLQTSPMCSSVEKLIPIIREKVKGDWESIPVTILFTVLLHKFFSVSSFTLKC